MLPLVDTNPETWSVQRPLENIVESLQKNLTNSPAQKAPMGYSGVVVIATIPITITNIPMITFIQDSTR